MNLTDNSSLPLLPELLEAVTTSMTGLLSSNLTANETSAFADISKESILRSGSEVAEAAPTDVEHSRGTLYAWIGLGILLVGIVFILGFVFIFDKVLRKKFFSSDSSAGNPESGDAKGDQTDGGTNGKSPTDFVKGEPNLPEPEPEEAAQKDPEEAQEDEEAESEQQDKRKRQEKVDETNEVELKPL